MPPPPYPHQSPTYTCTTEEELAKIYGPKDRRNDFVTGGSNDFNKITKVFDNPILESFSQKSIVPIVLPGMGAKKDKTVRVEVNRKLAPLLVAAFEKIKSENLAYIIHDVGGYYFRYKQNEGVRAVIENRAEYAGLNGGKPLGDAWNIHCAEHDRSTKAFDEQVLYQGKMTPKKDLLSNHSFGTAIDINYATNPFKKGKPFDMPLRIVEILKSLGFSWGGWYHDYMHFEYLRNTVDGLPDEEPPQVFYPFSQEQTRQSPLKYYFLNERGKGGYFPIGLMQNLHGGIHLEPATSGRTPVVATLPGYIVAARLMSPGKGGDNRDVRRLTDDRPLGFVLLRHELLDKEGGASTAPASHPLYSLYMHLAAPDWDAAASDAREAPWLASLLKMKFGGVVDLDPNSADAGKTFWSKAALSPEAVSFTVHGREAALTARGGDNRLALSKPTPEYLRQAICALQDGAIVTFDRALFPVAAGETLGFVGDNQPLAGQPTTSLENKSARYLHWELFSTADEGGALKLLSDRAAIGKLFAPVKELRQDNFLSMPSQDNQDAPNELQQMLGSSERIAAKLVSDHYAETLQTHFNEGKGFFPGQADTAPRFTYPLDIILEDRYHYQAGPTGKCALEVTFFKEDTVLKEEKLFFKPEQGKITLSVPAEADALDLWSPDFFLDRPEPAASDNPRTGRIKSRLALFEKAATHQWRNLLLDHLNEWTPAGLETQLDARGKAGHLDDLVDIESPTVFGAWKKNILPLSWWSRKKDEEDTFGEVPILGTEARAPSIFGSGPHQLSQSANTLNVHPVTGLWLIDILLEKETIALRKNWPPETLRRDASTRQPPFLGFLPTDDSLMVGLELLSILVQHGYGTTDGSNATHVVFWATPEPGAAASVPPQQLGRSGYQEGVSLLRASFPLWGAWRMHAADGEQQVFEPVHQQGTTLQIGKPELRGNTFRMSTGKDSSGSNKKTRSPITGSLSFDKNWPIALAGYIVFEYWRSSASRGPQPWEPSTLGAHAIPVVARRAPSKRTEGGLKYDGEFIVGREKPNNNPNVTTDFRFQDFSKVFDGDAARRFVLAVPLAQRLQELKNACQPRSPKEKPLRLVVKRLLVEGKGLDVTTASKAEAELEFIHQKLSQLPESPLFSVEKRVEDASVRITYHEPESAGPLELEFDPGRALGLLSAEVLSAPGEVLHVRPRFIAPNGGHLLLSDRPSPIGDSTRLITASLEEIQAACAQDYVEAIADRFLPPVGQFEFGEISVKMGAGTVHTEVQLLGDKTQWDLAAPRIKLTVGDELFFQARRSASALNADWELFKGRKQQPIPGRWGQILHLSVELTQPDLLAAPPPAPPPWTVHVLPRLEGFTHELNGEFLCFLGQARFMPTDLPLHVICERQDPAGQWKEDMPLTGLIRYRLVHTDQKPHYGCCSEKGIFEANVPKKVLQKVPGNFRFVWAPKGPRVGSTVDVRGIALEVQTSAEISSESLGA